MWPDRVSNPGPLALESDALPTDCATRPGHTERNNLSNCLIRSHFVFKNICIRF